MSYSKHTPGPWQHTEGGNICNCVGHTLQDDGHICVAFVQPIETAQANARLIAAAPELLTSLLDLVVMAENSNIIPGQTGNSCTRGQWESAVKAGRAAIAKATGKGV